MSLSAVTVLARLLAVAATTIEVADDEAVSPDLAEAPLDDLAAGCSDLSAEDRTAVA